ncbi:MULTISPECIES: ROK family transcriptional regulator [unclassified Clostridium]|uniref:ROK family transcriptional regulator n=1 Tax=unclassified Clostridium TaxID=2614128 RepID=UPI0025BCB9C9|nr:ROK family transcriptional regulator [Clostridium sp.]MCI6692092.1 ROK family transcriptional regulator [Clostridium sp.]MDY2632794.1 ROK family transcriptional regulator [Clostridium sp.]MDY4252282.1 ROK family transcriptional regulator [Clostridium sp.]MDY6227350.1 ROK family transcriptional regulator [Clostridium sp.]
MYKKDSEVYIQNVSSVLEFIYRNPRTSRIEISQATGLTPAAVTNIVAELMNKDWIKETGDEVSFVNGSGRRRKVLTLNNSIGYLLGVEFNMKGIFVTITDILGNVISRDYKNINKYAITHINDEIINLIENSITKVDSSKILGAGIAIPAHFDLTSETIISNNDMWKDFNLFEIKKHFSFPFIVENNIECMALGEYLFNPLNTPDKFLFFHVGHGLFCSFFDSANLGIKANYYIGEIGHTVVDINGPKCECGKKGCLQTYISESWLIKNAKFFFENSTNTILSNLVKNSEEISLQTIIAAYKLGDSYFKRNIELGIELLGTSISNTLIMRDADKIFLNSELLSHKEFSSQIVDIVQSQMMFIPSKIDLNIEVTNFDNFRGSRGGCALASFAFFIKNLNYSQ